MTDNDNILTEPQMHRVYDVARAVNVVNVKVEALRRQVEQHIAAADGADPVEGKDVCPKCGGSGMIYCGWGEAEYCECRRDWKKEYEDAEEAIGGLVDERDELRAERDEALARVAELEEQVATVFASRPIKVRDGYVFEAFRRSCEAIMAEWKRVCG